MNKQTTEGAQGTSMHSDLAKQVGMRAFAQWASENQAFLAQGRGLGFRLGVDQSVKTAIVEICGPNAAAINANLLDMPTQ